MQWSRLTSDRRFGMEDYHDGARPGTRSDFQRDFDRLVFSSPFRRLQNKTQVFPLPGSIFVHNRLTHSMEVASVGRSMADGIARALRPRYEGTPSAAALDKIGEIVSAACLAHDLGNPPFGHSGETAISTFFSEGDGADLQSELTAAQWADLTHFEGNANAFRVLTHQFHGRRKGGFAMTYSMLASIVKYPFSSTLAGSRNKFGFFVSEREAYERIAAELGIICKSRDSGAACYARHPLVYIVEAADDICYEVMDIEDAHKLKILSTDRVKELLLGFFDDARRRRCQSVMEHISDPNEQIAYLRSGVIGVLVECCADAFSANEEAILRGEFTGQLLHHVPEPVRRAYEACNAVSWDKIYRAPDVVDIELAGNRIITFLLQKLIHAVRHPQLNYSRLLLSKVPQQYDVHSPDLFTKVQAVLDHVSAMTDVYALDLYRKLNGLSLPVV
ncbi:MAG: dNTP triphosphohydrolase [Muribaculaceae bacterium]|nr:dNTP triphosphohydrolase [Muribaculaceae bacterium]